MKCQQRKSLRALRFYAKSLPDLSATQHSGDAEAPLVINRIVHEIVDPRPRIIEHENDPPLKLVKGGE